MSNLKQSNIFKAQKSDLVQALGTTIMGSMTAKKAIIDELNMQLRQDQTKAGGIAVPTFQYFRKNMCPSVDDELAHLYQSTMEQIAVDGWANVDRSVQIVQGVLFDGLMFVYDSQKDAYSLATLNIDLLERLGAKLPSWKTVIKDNGEGIVRAYRIDVSYSSAEKDLSYKAVQARDFAIDEVKDDSDETKRFTLVPYHFIEQLIEVVAKQLDDGNLIQVAQTVGGMRKVRFITKNKEILEEYCDDPSAVVTDARYFPDLGFFYAPSVGASSFTSMVTNVSVFDIDAMSLFRDKDILVRSGVTKPKSPIRDLIGESLVCGELARYAQSGDAKFEAVCESLSYSKKLIQDSDKISVSSIAKYLHSVSSTSKEKAYALCGVKNKVNELEEYFSQMSTRPLDPNEDVKALARDSVLRVVLQKEKDCKLSSVFCTNDEDVLAKVYGENYKRRYESFASCFYGFFNWASRSEGLSDEAIKLHLIEEGLVYDDDVIEEVRSIINKKRGTDEFEEVLKGYLAGKMGVDVKRSTASSNAQTSSIMVRTLTAFLDYDNKPYDFYRYIDPAKIIRGTVFELK